MLNASVLLAPAAADDNGISLSQTPAAGGVQNLTITGALASGGVATLDVARRVAITSAGNDSSLTFIVYGTDRYGNAQQESITGGNTAAVYTTYDFKTVTAITVSGNTAAAVIAGTNGVLSSQWFPLDCLQNSFLVGLFAVVTGTINYTVQHTPKEVIKPGVQPVSSGYIFNYDGSDLTSSTTSNDGNYAFPVQATRITINSYSTGATVDFHVIQNGGRT